MTISPAGPHTADVIIVGQGLAGTALGWHLLARGRRVAFVDSPAPSAASRVAAGLLTPVTGTRLAVTPDYADRHRQAVAHYRAVEAATGRTLFHDRPAVRLFADAAERERLARKPEAAAFVRLPAPPLPADAFAAPFGGAEMPAAGRLDVPAYLAASRDHFRTLGPYFETDLDLSAEVELTAAGVRVPRLGLTAGRLVFCQGFTDRPNPWFAAVGFNPAKGEILAVRVPGLDETRVVTGGVWLAPAGGGVFRVGATYDRSRLDAEPTAAGRDELTAKLRRFLRLPVEVIEHRAAVRPIISVRRPVLGTHPGYPQLAFFNGLGSKGSLVAPHYAAALAEHLVDGTPVDPEADVAGRLGLRRPPGGC